MRNSWEQSSWQYAVNHAELCQRAIALIEKSRYLPRHHAERWRKTLGELREKYPALKDKNNNRPD